MRRALDLFSKRKNALVNPSKWDDPFENYFVRSRILGLGFAELEVRNLQSSWYGQCWTTLHESDAMWRIYSPGKDGVRICTTPRQLLLSCTSLHDNSRYTYASLFIGKVTYMEAPKLLTKIGDLLRVEFSLGIHNQGCARTLLLKRPEFSHECEVRLLCCDLQGRFADPDVAEFDFDPLIVQDVMFDPRLEPTALKAHEKVFREAGCQCQITQSTLYQLPKLVIDLR